MITVDLRKAIETGEIHNVKHLKQNKYGWTIEMHDAQKADSKLLDYHLRHLRDRDKGKMRIALASGPAAAPGDVPDALRSEVDIRYIYPDEVTCEVVREATAPMPAVNRSEA